MPDFQLEMMQDDLSHITRFQALGRISALDGTLIYIEGLSSVARLGDRIQIRRKDQSGLCGEVIKLSKDHVVMLPEEVATGIALNEPVVVNREAGLRPSEAWIGRVVDPFGTPLDGKHLPKGTDVCALRAAPPALVHRRKWGGRLETGLAAFNTLLPIVQGQRVGLFAGSGVGKSSLLGRLGRHMQADVVVFALIGERGRELRDFVEGVLGPEGMARTVVMTATSDMSPLVRRRCAWSAMAVAEYFRDQGKHVLLLMDSITRFAEAHREVAIAAGELPALRGFPASATHMIMSLCERAGPGAEGCGDITALMSVLVAGSDMDEPIADILRGVLDGHVVLERSIAERGRFPAIDLLRSVSRSLPSAANEEENQLIAEVRRLMGAYQRSEAMIKAGLYTSGSDLDLDQAIAVWPQLDAFLSEIETVSSKESFHRLALILRRTAGRVSGVQVQ